MVNKLKVSRARWAKGTSYYYRKRAKNWRSRATGEVRNSPTSSKVISHEETNYHPYGFQKKISKQKSRQAQKLFGVKGVRTGGRR